MWDWLRKNGSEKRQSVGVLGGKNRITQHPGTKKKRGRIEAKESKIMVIFHAVVVEKTEENSSDTFSTANATANPSPRGKRLRTPRKEGGISKVRTRLADNSCGVLSRVGKDRGTFTTGQLRRCERNKV